MALTQSQMVAAVADRADMSRADAKRALDALDEIVLEELGNAQKVRLGGLVQLTVRVKPATKKRTGRNPATGEEITIAAKPASVDVRARPLAKAKAVLPSVQKARRRLADAARDSARSPRSAAERQARQTSLAWTSPANAQLRRNRAASPTPAPLCRSTVRDGRPRRPTSSFCAVWLSSTSGSHAVATPDGRRTRPQQSRARRWRRHRRRQFSHPRIAVRIRQSPASLPAVVHSTSPAPAARRTRVAGGAEEPLLARRIGSSKRRRQDAYAAPRRRRTRARSRRLSLRRRERLCSPARTPRCRSSSIPQARRRLGGVPALLAEQKNRY